MAAAEESLPPDSESESSEDSDAEESVELSSITFSAAMLKEVLEKLEQDKSVVNCSLGDAVVEVAKKCVANISSTQVDKFAETIVKELTGLLSCDKRKKKRIKLFQFWRKFHALRLSPTIRAAWEECADALHFPQSTKNATLQVVLKRMVDSVIVSQSIDVSNSVRMEGMTKMEENVVRYVGGYVVAKIKKKFPNQAEFLDAFKGGLSMDMDFSGHDVHDYTRIWTEQVDRGGLHHISDVIYNLFVAIEHICRRYLDTRVPSAGNISQKILEHCQNDDCVQEIWKECDPGPSKKSGEIFNYAVQLFINVRIHSYSKRWSSQLLQSAKSNTKSIRKTLKHKGTEKDAA